MPFTEHLPVVEDEPSIKPRSAKEVVERALALAIVAVKGEANDQQLVHELIARYTARELFTPAELAFITNRLRLNSNPRISHGSMSAWLLSDSRNNSPQSDKS